MKKIVILSLLCYCYLSTTAQSSLKIPVRHLQKHVALLIWDASLNIEGYDGDDLIIQRQDPHSEEEISNQTAGLKNINLDNKLKEDSSMTYKVVADNENLFQINLTGRFENLHVKVPNNLKLFSITSNNLFSDAKVVISNLKGDLQVESLKGLIQVSKVTGSLSISSESGKIVLSDIFWTHNPSTKYNIGSRNGDLDVTLPINLKADFVLQTINGEIYSNLNLREGLKLNGGGECQISITSRNGNIFLRKQE